MTRVLAALALIVLPVLLAGLVFTFLDSIGNTLRRILK